MDHCWKLLPFISTKKKEKKERDGGKKEHDEKEKIEDGYSSFTIIYLLCQSNWDVQLRGWILPIRRGDSCIQERDMGNRLLGAASMAGM